MPRPFPLALSVFLFLPACARQASTSSDELVVSATLLEAPFYAAGRSFAVGIQSALRVADATGTERTVVDVRCLAETCTVESVSNGTGRVFLVTPKTREFVVSIEVDAFGDAPNITFERHVPAVDGEMIALHRGAGPGVPFVAGMKVIWYVGTKAKNVAWDAHAATAVATPPFAVVDDPFAADALDGDEFLRVAIRAPNDLDRVTSGTVVVRDGAMTASFDVVAVPPADIASLHVAPAPDVFERHGAADEPRLAEVTSDRLLLPAGGVKRAWLVFETREGLFGIAGAGDCLPARNAAFTIAPYQAAFYGFELDWNSRDVASHDLPYLELLPATPKAGTTSQLLLAFGDRTGSADVVIVEGGRR